MRQRVMIAIALSVEPQGDPLRRADDRARRDDPGPDPEAAGVAPAASEVSIVFVSHDLAVVAQTCQRHRRHVRRPGRRDRPDRRRVPRAAPPVHPRPPALGPALDLVQQTLRRSRVRRPTSLPRRRAAASTLDARSYSPTARPGSSRCGRWATGTRPPASIPTLCAADVRGPGDARWLRLGRGARRAAARGAGLRKHFPLNRRLVTPSARDEPETVRAVDGVDLAIAPGEVLGLVGESGCGKSTLGRCIVGLYEPTAGRDPVRGRAARREARARRAAPHPDGLPGSLLLAQPAHDGAPGTRRAAARPPHGARGGRSTPAADELLDLVGLRTALDGRLPAQFSGGQRQRVSIARALALEPDLLVADEPVSALDVSVQATVLNLLEDLRARLGLTVLLIAHNMAVVRHVCDRVAVMYLGRIVEIAPTEELFTNPRHPYTQALLRRSRGWRRAAARRRRRSSAIHRARSACRAAVASTRVARSWRRSAAGRTRRSRSVPGTPATRRPATSRTASTSWCWSTAVQRRSGGARNRCQAKEVSWPRKGTSQCREEVSGTGSWATNSRMRSPFSCFMEGRASRPSTSTPSRPS